MGVKSWVIHPNIHQIEIHFKSFITNRSKASSFNSNSYVYLDFKIQPFSQTNIYLYFPPIIYCLRIYNKNTK